ncbi:unnamed protein product, partial [Discosporangium mesarthrocarpum]
MGYAGGGAEEGITPVRFGAEGGDSGSSFANGQGGVAVEWRAALQAVQSIGASHILPLLALTSAWFEGGGARARAAGTGARSLGNAGAGLRVLGSPGTLGQGGLAAAGVADLHDLLSRALESDWELQEGDDRRRKALARDGLVE